MKTFKIKNIIVLLSILWGLAAHGQMVINASGQSVSVGNYILEDNVGEMVLVETWSSPENMLTQGFLQPLPLDFFGPPSGGDPLVVVYPDVSPNDDGLGHDNLYIEDIEQFPVNDIKIFNRWGNLIYVQKGYDNAEKSFKGKANTGLLIDGAEVPDGTYYYILHVLDPLDGITDTYKGFFVIKRK